MAVGLKPNADWVPDAGAVGLKPNTDLVPAAVAVGLKPNADWVSRCWGSWFKTKH